MTALILNVGEKLALSLMLAKLDSVNSMPEAGQYQDEFEQGLADHLERRVDQMSDDIAFEQMRERIRTDAALEKDFRDTVTSVPILDTLRVPAELLKNIGNGSVSLVTTEQLKPGDICVLASMRFSAAFFYLRMAHRNEGQSMSEWIQNARLLFTRFKNDPSDSLFRKVIDFLEIKQPDAASFVRSNSVVIVEKMIQEKLLTPENLRLMFANDELTTMLISSVDS